jgi:hypothetical protein
MVEACEQCLLPLAHLDDRPDRCRRTTVRIGARLLERLEPAIVVIVPGGQNKDRLLELSHCWLDGRILLHERLLRRRGEAHHDGGE